MPSIIFNKDYSIKRSIADAWRMIALGWKGYLKALWPYMLLAGIANALFLELSIQYTCERGYPAQLLEEMGGAAEVVNALASPSISEILCLVLAFLFTVLADLAFTGRVFHVIKHYRVHNEMPKALQASPAKDERCTLKRLVIAALLASILILGLSAGIFYCAMKFSKWIFIALPIVVIYLLPASILFYLKYAVYDCTLKCSAGYALKHALGGAFIVVLLTEIPIGFVCGIACMPEWLYTGEKLAMTRAFLADDLTGPAPGLLPFVNFVICSICHAAIMLTKSYGWWAVALKLNRTKNKNNSHSDVR